MAHRGSTGSAVIEKLMEFERFAGLLDIPEAERLGILNLSEESYDNLRAGGSVAISETKPELERRLSYALPLMRRLASNSSVVRMQPSGKMVATG